MRHEIRGRRLPLQDELIFLEGIFSFKALFADKEVSFECKNPSEKNVADAAFAALEICRQTAFENSPIQLQQIKPLAGNQRTLSPLQLQAAISAISPSRLEEELRKYSEAAKTAEQLDPLAKAPKGEPVEIAFSAYLGELFDKTFPQEKVSWQKKGSSPREIRLVANYAGWMAVKKVNLAVAEKKEVVAGCASIFATTKTKLCAILHPDFQAFRDAFLAKYPERKSFSRLTEVLSAAEKELPKISAMAGGDKLLEQRLQKLFFYACFERAGFTPFVSTDQVSRIWPELKIPKPKGNFGKKKTA